LICRIVKELTVIFIIYFITILLDRHLAPFFEQISTNDIYHLSINFKKKSCFQIFFASLRRIVSFFIFSGSMTVDKTILCYAVKNYCNCHFVHDFGNDLTQIIAKTTRENSLFFYACPFRHRLIRQSVKLLGVFIWNPAGR